MKKIIGTLVLFTLFFGSFSQVFAVEKETIIKDYSTALFTSGMKPEQAAKAKAEKDVDALIKIMESDQTDIKVAFESMRAQVDALSKTSTRRDAAIKALDTADDKVDVFTDLKAEKQIEIVTSAEDAVVVVPPYVAPISDFTTAKDGANKAIVSVRRVIIAPERPGVVKGDPDSGVPKGDIISDFIPQVVRQLFRFAWLAILVAFTVSGIMLIIAHDNDEMITKAKGMIYYSLIGFAFITLAFAIVKAVTDIDFFNFV